MGLFWNTLRTNNRNYLDNGRIFEKHFPFKRGSVMAAILLGACNLHCDYCPMFLTDKKYPKFELCTLEEWKHFFSSYPDFLSLIYLTGGETSLLPWISDLVNWLTERGHHVCLFSNLYKPENFLGIKKTYKFILVPTFHTPIHH